MSYRANLEREIKTLHFDIIKMGTMAEKAIDMTIEALTNQDIQKANKVIKNDDQFDQLEVEIENHCITIIATQQPLASDLRQIISIQRITTDIERIADQCADICYYTKKLANEVYIKPLVDIPKMANEVKKMMHMAIDAYIDQDIELAIEVIKNDDIVDDYFKKIYMEIEAYIQKNSQCTYQGLNFLMIGKYLERMADHATNIAESVVYFVDGRLKQELHNDIQKGPSL